MRVLVACEFSGIVRDAFLKRGHEAWSCDPLASEAPTYGGLCRHYRTTIEHVIGDYGPRCFDLVIAHPPCTYLASSGARWFKTRLGEQHRALAFVRWLLALQTEHVAVENPIGVISTKIRKPDQIVQPWMFGHGEVKATCLWLKNLPKLTPTNIVDGRQPRVHHEPPSPDRWKNRSRTLQGLADAMADQWGVL